MSIKVKDILNQEEKARYSNTMGRLDKEKTLVGVVFYIVKARWILYKAQRRYIKNFTAQKI